MCLFLLILPFLVLSHDPFGTTKSKPTVDSSVFNMLVCSIQRVAPGMLLRGLDSMFLEL